MPAEQLTKMKAQQYFMLGEDPPGIRLELVDGEIEMSPSPTTSHSYTIQMLSFLLIEHEKSYGSGIVLGDLDTQLDDFNVRRPDLLYFSEARRHLVSPDRLRGVPDLAVEVISPASVKLDRVTKFKSYGDAGIEYYWIVDPIEFKFEAFHLRDGQYRVAVKGEDQESVSAPPLMNLVIPLGRLWMKRQA